MPDLLHLRDFLRPAPDMARRLIGCTLLVDGVGGTIVETEAYDMHDAASHCHPGRTERNRAMFGPPGHAYIYRSYGIHWCLNFVCDDDGHGAGVLIRALRPTHGLEQMRRRRSQQDEHLLCSGPGRLGQALDISPGLYGLPLDQPPFAVLSPAQPPPEVISGPRIGISKARDLPWRFGWAGSRFLSRGF